MGDEEEEEKKKVGEGENGARGLSHVGDEKRRRREIKSGGLRGGPLTGGTHVLTPSYLPPPPRRPRTFSPPSLPPHHPVGLFSSLGSLPLPPQLARPLIPLDYTAEEQVGAFLTRLPHTAHRTPHTLQTTHLTHHTPHTTHLTHPPNRKPQLIQSAALVSAAASAGIRGGKGIGNIEEDDDDAPPSAVAAMGAALGALGAAMGAAGAAAAAGAGAAGGVGAAAQKAIEQARAIAASLSKQHTTTAAMAPATAAAATATAVAGAGSVAALAARPGAAQEDKKARLKAIVDAIPTDKVRVWGRELGEGESWVRARYV